MFRHQLFAVLIIALLFSNNIAGKGLSRYKSTSFCEIKIIIIVFDISDECLGN